MDVFVKTTLTKLLLRKFPDMDHVGITGRFQQILVSRRCQKKHRVFARHLLVHLKHHPKQISMQDMERALFPKPRVYCKSTTPGFSELCSVDGISPVTYLAAPGGWMTSANKTGGGPTRFCKRCGKGECVRNVSPSNLTIKLPKGVKA